MEEEEKEERKDREDEKENRKMGGYGEVGLCGWRKGLEVEKLEENGRTTTTALLSMGNTKHS